MAVQSEARSSASLLAGVTVAVRDCAPPTLCAAWWLSELGAALLGTPGDGAPLDGLAAIAHRRLQATDGRSAAYVIRTRHVGDQGPPADGATVLTLVDPFGADHPVLEGWSGAAAWATSGMAALTASISGDRGGARLRVPADDHGAYVAGSFGAVVLLALEWAAGRGRPRPAAVDVDLQEVLAALIQQPVAASQLEEGALPSVFHAPGGVKQAADGLAYVQAVEPAHWARLIAEVGGVDGVELSDPPSMSELIANRASIDAALDRWVATERVDPLVARLQDAHLPAAPVSRPADLPADEHLVARHFFEDRRPTVPWIRTTGTDTGVEPPRRPAGRCRPRSSLPLEGLRVLDLTWAWAGPFATTILADLGAEIVNVEWWPRPSNLRTQNPTVAPDSPDGCGWWSANRRGKLSVGVNLKRPEGVQVVHDLAAVCDVAIENFSTGVADRLGVGADALQRRNPALVWVSLSAFGSSGPHAHWIGYGTQLIAASGMARSMMAAGEDDVALMGIPYPDPLAGLAGAIGVLAAVGRGASRLDVSMLEAACLAVAGTIERGRPARRRTWRPVVVDCADGRRVLAACPDGALDGLTSTAATNPRDVVAAVRAAGGDAAVVATPASVRDDERLAGRAFWRPDLAPELRAAGVVAAGPPFTIDGERPAWWRGAPDLFEDTAAVLRDVLRYEADTIDALAALGAVAVGADATCVRSTKDKGGR